VWGFFCFGEPFFWVCFLGLAFGCGDELAYEVAFAGVVLGAGGVEPVGLLVVDEDGCAVGVSAVGGHVW